MSSDVANDATTTVAALKKLVVDFVKERKWEVYHSPRNLAASIAIEAAELLECFQWTTPEEAEAVKDDPAQKQAAAEEIADVLSYLLDLCVRLDVDLASAFVAKMKKNAQKYPVEKIRGAYGLDDPKLRLNGGAPDPSQN